MQNTQIDATHPDAKKAQAFMDAWEAGEAWAHGLKVGDVFNGAHREATLKYFHAEKEVADYAISAFTSAGYRIVKNMEIYVNDAGIITKLVSRTGKGGAA